MGVDEDVVVVDRWGILGVEFNRFNRLVLTHPRC